MQGSGVLQFREKGDFNSLVQKERETKADQTTINLATKQGKNRIQSYLFYYQIQQFTIYVKISIKSDTNSFRIV